MASPEIVKDRAPAQTIGVLAKTIIKPPVLRWILHARLRSRWYNDVVFVGEDFIHVKHVGLDGHLEHVAFKNDFDARIRAARVLCLDLDDAAAQDYLDLKIEDDASSSATRKLPHDLLVLTLDSPDDLVFVHMRENEDGKPYFIQRSIPIPRAESLLSQPGYHLAIDPRSRAIAVAANEREVAIWSLEDIAVIRDQVHASNDARLPTSVEREVQVPGVIQHMEFLFPSDDDQDRVILLIIVIEDRTTKAIWLDWTYKFELQDVQIHPSQALHSSSVSTNLLIPLRNTAFMLTTGNEVRLWKDLLSGSLTCRELEPFEAEAKHGASSPLQPMWVSWCRPQRTQTFRQKWDSIYLVREDGLVYYLTVETEETIFTSSAGHFDCHVDTAFASLSDANPGADILAVAGEMSTGRLVSIGPWSSLGRNIELPYGDAMAMDLIETIPNWATVTDMLTMSSKHTSTRAARAPRPGFYVTSGRQPYGAITELRSGLEARLSTYFTLDELHSVTNTWALPLLADGSILVFLAFPSATRILNFSADAGNEIQELSGDACAGWDLNKATLAATATLDGRIVHVSTNKITVTSGLKDNWEDTKRRIVDDEARIVSAAVLPGQAMVVTIESGSAGPHIHCIQFPLDDEASNNDIRDTALHLDSEPIAVAAALISAGIVAAVSCADGIVHLTRTASDCSVVRPFGHITLPSMQTEPAICDHLAILRSESVTDFLLICGLRDGRVHCQTMSITDTSVDLGTAHTIDYGHSSVRLTALRQLPSAVCAISGIDICMITWTGHGANDLEIDRIWVSDKARPELQQAAVAGVTQMPSSDLLASPLLADALVLISGDEFQVTTLLTAPTIVPRQIPVDGTPTRMTYAERQQCLVVASIKTEALADMRRKIWPVIEFIPMRNAGAACTYDLQPGERIYSLLEWNYKSGDDKTYSFVLVGGSYQRRSGAAGGRIRFLQQSGRDASEVREGHVEKFAGPVFALALFDELTYVVCYGESVALLRFQHETKKWKELCEPFKLLSPGVYVTVEGPLIFISTMADSLVTLSLDTDEENGDAVYRLTYLRSGPRADRLTSHLTVHREGTLCDIALLATRQQRIVGITCDNAGNPVLTHSTSADLLFEADLPRSVTRLRQSSLRPRWKPSPPQGVVVDNIIGSSPDGALLGIALLNQKLWKTLSWLQRLCEWDQELSPHTHSMPPYSASDNDYSGEDRALPIGLASVDKGERQVLLRTHVPKSNDKHINGDILVRLLERGGAEKLRSMIMEAAQRNDRVGEWMAEHVDDELGAVDEVIGALGPLLDCWF